MDVALGIGGDRGPRSRPEPCARSNEPDGGVEGPGCEAAAYRDDGRVTEACKAGGNERTVAGTSGGDGGGRGDLGEAAIVRYSDARRTGEGGLGPDCTVGCRETGKEGCRMGRRDCGRLMTMRFVVVDVRLAETERVYRRDLDPGGLCGCPSITAGSSSRPPPNVRPEATDERGADRDGNLRELSACRRVFRRVLGWCETEADDPLEPREEEVITERLEFRADEALKLDGARETGVIPSEDVGAESGDQRVLSRRIMSEPMSLSKVVRPCLEGSVSSTITFMDGRCLLERAGPTMGPVWMYRSSCSAYCVWKGKIRCSWWLAKTGVSPMRAGALAGWVS